jgi:hypothetical protein
MHEIKPPIDDVLWVKVSGTLSKEDYADLVPSWEKMIARFGKLKLLFEMEPGFTGWGPIAGWDDLKFSVSHRNDLDRVAIVGSKNWEETAGKLWSALVQTEVKYFEQGETEKALAWLRAAQGGS